MFKMYFSLLVDKQTSLATLKACQEPFSSTCMIVVAHSKLDLKTYEFRETPISHESFTPTLLTPC